MAFTDTTGSSHKFLMEASLLYQDICPEQSRFLMGRHQRMKAPAKLQPIPEDELCPFCFQWRRPDNHRMRLHPKRRASLRVQSVLRREARGKRLSLAQMDILRRFRGSSSVLVRITLLFSIVNPQYLKVKMWIVFISAKPSSRAMMPVGAPETRSAQQPAWPGLVQHREGWEGMGMGGDGDERGGEGRGGGREEERGEGREEERRERRGEERGGERRGGGREEDRGERGGGREERGEERGEGGGEKEGI
ncbi:unnamed protein product, partial [Coregonus sp. 'balchen']